MTLSAWTLFLSTAIGLCVGSFLNVLIHRLPRIIQDNAPLAGLAFPASHCPHCHHPIRWFHNLPLISFFWLRGRCADCHAPISWRYPAIELLCAIIWGVCALHWGWGWTAGLWALFISGLLALSVIDAQTQLLPDVLTLGLMWLGLLSAVGQPLLTTPSQAIMGAAMGYGSFWLVGTLFKTVTGKDGIGAGDFKLMAALGAWLGAAVLPLLVLLASLVASVVALGLIWRGHLRRTDYVPFGPFLALAAVVIVGLDPERVLWTWFHWFSL